MIKNILHPKKQRGFIILFAMTLASLLLSIALGIANVSYRELTFSTSARESNDAFLAADTGAECILSHDKQSEPLPVIGVSGSIDSNSIVIGCGSGAVTGDVVFDADVSTNTNTAIYNLTIPSLGPSQAGCASVELVKENVDGFETFTMTSKGYNGDCGSKGSHSVEREIHLSSVAGASGASTPPSSTTPSVTLTSDFPSVISGGPVNLSWSTTGVSGGCTESSTPSTGWSILPMTFGSGTVEVSGITSDTTFTFTCTGVSTPASVTVAVISEKTEGGTASAGGTACSGTEGPDKAFDNLMTSSSFSKWCVMRGASPSTPAPIMYDFAGSTAHAVTTYTITTGNDVPARDPKDWTFQACKVGFTCTADSGANWDVLDTRTSQFSGASRYQTNTYSFSNTTAYQQYRLRISANNGDTTYTQITELQMY